MHRDIRIGVVAEGPSHNRRHHCAGGRGGGFSRLRSRCSGAAAGVRSRPIRAAAVGAQPAQAWEVEKLLRERESWEREREHRERAEREREQRAAVAGEGESRRGRCR